MLLTIDQDARRAAIAAVLYRFDAGDRAHAEKCAHRRPIERRPETQLELEHVGCGGGGNAIPPLNAQLTGLEAVALLEKRVEAPNAAEAARERDLSHRQHGIGQQA